MTWRAAVVAAVLAWIAVPAAAQPDDDEPEIPTGPVDTGFIGAARVALEIDDCPVSPNLPEAQLESMAYERYERGNVLHLQGDYAGAVAELVHGYCLWPPKATPLLKYIAQSYERLVQYEKAVAYLERYLLQIATQPGTDEEQQAIGARIQVLRRLRSTITVATEPTGAVITVANDAGPIASEADGQRLEVTAGNYTLIVEKTGYEPIRKPILIGIGQPYSFSFRLAPKSGRLRIQAVPGDARIFIDDRLAGIGSYAGDIEIGPHKISFEARGYIDAREDIEIIAGETKQVSKSLERPPTSGKTQLVVAATLAGTVYGAVAVGGSTDDPLFGTFGGLAGLAIGGAGTYFLYDDIDLGSSSYIITSGMIGAVEGSGLAILASNDSDAWWIGGLVGMGAGAGFAVLTADRFELSAGDAALLNSGASWGLVSGMWFTQVFHSTSDNVGAGLVLGGTNLGVVGGVLLGRTLEYSRKHVALIDLSGLAGIAAGLALHSGIVGNGEDEMVERDEQQAHFALAGMALGLAGGALLTRNLDAPKLPRLQPQITPAGSSGKGWILSFGGGF